MLMYEAVHFHNKLSPQKSGRIRRSSGNSSNNSSGSNNTSNNNKQDLLKTRSTNNMEKLINQNSGFNRTGSFVVGQKLRESKWFTHEELKILCAVIETGFIVELKTSDNDDNRFFGITLWDPGFEKSKNPDHIKICTLKEAKNNNLRVTTLTLMDFWANDTMIRINNQNDKNNVPHKEEVIRDQIANAELNKSKWHNAEHFTYWCRYGPPHINHRSKHNSVSDNQKWGSFGLNGFLLLKNRFRRMTTK